MKGFSDEAHYPWGRGLESPKKKSTKSGQPSNYHQAIENFDSSLKAHLSVFQCHRKEEKFVLFSIIICQPLLDEV